MTTSTSTNTETETDAASDARSAYAAFRPTYALLADLLGRAPEETARALLRRCRAHTPTLSPLLISLLAAEGTALGSGALDELSRARAKAAGYREIGDWAAESGARTSKGPSLARRYPPELLRPVGGLELVAPTEAALWDVVIRLYRTYPVDEVKLSVLRIDGERHLYVGLYWPAADPLLDRSCNVEVTTFALGGDGAAVPPRAVSPQDPAIADLLAVAEERFKGEFTAKDLLDTALTLSPRHAPEPDRLVEQARRYLLAPELRELIAVTRDRLALPDPLGARASRELDEAARRELERRARPAGTADGPGRDRAQASVPARLAAGLPVRGIPLGAPRLTDAAGARQLTLAGQPVLRSPIGDFLLVGGAKADPDDYAAALAASRGPETREAAR